MERRIQAERGLREHVLDEYVATSAGPHLPLTEAERDAYARAYSYHLRGWVPAPTSGSWLDLGCGQGALMFLAQRLGYNHIRGVDISGQMLDSCRSSGLSVEQADIWEFLARCAADQWQVVSAFDLLEHFPKEEGYRLLREIHRVLAPGGVCLLKLPNAMSPWGGGVTASDLTHEAAYSPYSLIQIARLAGFTAAEVREVGPAPTGWVARARRALWQLVRAAYGVANLIETGSARRGVYTQVMMARLTK